MKTICSLEVLQSAIRKLERIPTKQVSLPILNSFLVEVGKNNFKIRATNISCGVEISIPANTDGDFSCVVPSDVFAQTILNTSNDSMITLNFSEGQVSVETKNTKTKIRFNGNTEEFPDLVRDIGGDPIGLESVSFLKGIENVAFSASLTDIKPELSSVYVYNNGAELVFVATDSFRLAEKKVQTMSVGDFSVLIPQKNVQDILRVFGDYDGEIEVCCNGGQMTISSPGIFLNMRVVTGSFPDYRQIIPTEWKTRAIALKQDVVGALKLTNLFSDTFNQIHLDFDPEGGFIDSRAENTNKGDNLTKIPCHLEGEATSLTLNHKYIIEGVSVINDDSVEIQSGGKGRPILIRGVEDQSFLYIIMPINR